MSNPVEDRFRKCWDKTEIRREYRRMLFTFGSVVLPYVYVAESNHFNDKVIVKKGNIRCERPNIILPGQYSGPQFGEGFSDPVPLETSFIFRTMGLPYCIVDNKIISTEGMEYGRLGKVLERLNEDLERNGDDETALIKGLYNGLEVSLRKYFIGISTKSVPGNMKEFADHMRRQQDVGPIDPDEILSDEDFQRLLKSY